MGALERMDADAPEEARVARVAAAEVCNVLNQHTDGLVVISVNGESATSESPCTAWLLFATYAHADKVQRLSCIVQAVLCPMRGVSGRKG